MKGFASCILRERSLHKICTCTLHNSHLKLFKTSLVISQWMHDARLSPPVSGRARMKTRTKSNHSPEFDYTRWHKRHGRALLAKRLVGELHLLQCLSWWAAFKTTDASINTHVHSVNNALSPDGPLSGWTPLTSGWKHRDAVVPEDRRAESTTPFSFFLLLNRRQTNPTQTLLCQRCWKMASNCSPGFVEFKATLKSGFMTTRAFRGKI